MVRTPMTTIAKNVICPVPAAGAAKLPDTLDLLLLSVCVRPIVHCTRE